MSRFSIVRSLEKITDEAIITSFILRMDSISIMELFDYLEYASETTRERWQDAYSVAFMGGQDAFSTSRACV